MSLLEQIKLRGAIISSEANRYTILLDKTNFVGIGVHHMLWPNDDVQVQLDVRYDATRPTPYYGWLSAVVGQQVLEKELPRDLARKMYEKVESYYQRKCQEVDSFLALLARG